MLNRIRRWLTSHDQPRTRTGTLQGEAASGFEVTGGVPEIDYLDDLAFPDYISEFKRVANDPQVAKELRSTTLPLISADWTIEAASDDVRDATIAEFVAANLFNQEGGAFGRRYWMRVPWENRLRDILRMLQNGFSVFQKVRRIEGRFTIYDIIKYLQPETIERWKFDDVDNLVHIQRQYTGADGRSRRNEIIEARDLVIYTWDQEGSNILGHPLIRPMWKPYKMKFLLEKLQMVDKQKTVVGVPFFQLQEGASPADEKEGERLVKTMRMGNFERAYAVLKNGQDFGWKEGGQGNKAVPEILLAKDQQIAAAGMSRLEELGMTASGSRGVAGGIGAFEATLHTAIAFFVAAHEQRNAIELVDMNFLNVSRYPKVRFSRIDPFEQTRSLPEFATTLSTLRTARVEPELENEVRRRYHMIELPEDTAALPGGNGDGEQGGGAGDDPGAGATPPDPSGGDDNGVPTPPTLRHHRLATADPLEAALVNTEKVRDSLVRFETGYLTILNAGLRDIREILVAEVRQGKLQPTRPNQVTVPFVSDMRDRLAGLLRTVRDFGRQELRDEVDRQTAKAGRISLQVDPTARRGAVSFATAQAKVLVELDLSNLAQRLQSQVVGEYNRLLTQGLDNDGIADELDLFLKTISDRQVREMARTSTSTSFNLGRNIAVQELKDQIQPFAVRTEVLDSNTCTPCRRLNGKRVRIGSDAYFRNLPPAQCKGRLRCRGFYLVFPK